MDVLERHEGQSYGCSEEKRRKGTKLLDQTGKDIKHCGRNNSCSRKKEETAKIFSLYLVLILSVKLC